MENTLLEFGGVAACLSEDSLRRRVCAVCGSRFSGDAQFCPFDGEPLGPGDDARPDTDPLSGTIVDQRYRVVGVLGEGGMGTVYEVEHVTLQRRFALKALRRDLGRLTELSARFIQEAKAAAAISHPNVVQIADFGHLPSGEAYFVMELLGGEPLSRVIRREGRLGAPAVLSLAIQIGEALGAAHAAGIIHRDLKPDNIQICPGITDRPLVKVLDFGLAKVAGASKLTRAGMVFGTPHYMSPEQAAGDPLDHRSDIYALGVVLYEMVTGRVPFEADTFMGVLTKHMYMAPPNPSDIVPPEAAFAPLEAVVLRCLEKDPAARFGSMVELLAVLEGLAAKLDPTRAPRGSSVAGWRPGAAPRTRASRVLPAILAGVVVVLLGGAAVAAWLVARGGLPEGAPTKEASVEFRTAADPSTVLPPTPSAPAGPSVAAPDAPVAARASAPADVPGSARASPGRTTPGSAAKSAPRAPAAAPAPQRVGGGEIVNPWEN